ncbi:hypothetical protein PM082_013574 [Marasmius tenuissimus]|nr:hypothetical protein PM082_013574 [Marasmius tenuissimus]
MVEIEDHPLYLNADYLTKKLIKDACKNVGWGAHVHRRGMSRVPRLPKIPKPKEVVLPNFTFVHEEWLTVELYTDFAAYAWNERPVRGINFIHQLLINDFAELRLPSTGDSFKDDRNAYQQKEASKCSPVYPRCSNKDTTDDSTIALRHWDEGTYIRSE